MLTLCANFKGGTGKSTVVFNLALWLAARGTDVTVCDLDPQRTVTDVAEIREEMGYEPAIRMTHELPGKGGARGEWRADDLNALEERPHGIIDLETELLAKPHMILV